MVHPLHILGKQKRTQKDEWGFEQEGLTPQPNEETKECKFDGREPL